MTEFVDLVFAFENDPTNEALSKPVLDALKAHEQELQFDGFNSQDALDLGMIILSLSPKVLDPTNASARSIVVHVSVNGHLLFYHSQDGTAPDNFDWIRRKVATVDRFGIATIHVGSACMAAGTTVSQKYGISASEYVGAGGGFPLRIKGVERPVGVIACSGLPHMYDHDLLVRSIKKFLDGKK
ncbi:hypothetical protein V1512DRAFT_208846 [Lipomyces arxii]|uniref:uncharacterized protein n=1 Tax=Lipomyces arxii TaxID=56418 RepID=UPI0034CD45F9